ncbi:outer membrane beta-barrel protein [Dickeya fangzhongdai]|uniref:outer membrane beta-barrel protein n=1 Tax=Dickeya fangzhongdai TaxID=1778540 RepID=UPI001EFA4289|nr:outer membrane beta-barrel protein [Dickeya fangzhongdai]ULR33262.1 outer membrane beta-barrel protein [Dickeya fangzhongdai]
MRTKLIIAAGMIMPHPSWADLTPKSHIGIAGIDFQSQVGLDYGHENNVTYQAYDQDAVSSDFHSVRPMIKAIGARYQDQYLLMYSGDYRRYDRDSADNYTDHFFRFNGVWRYGLKHGLTLSLEDSLGHEARGRGISEGFRPQQFSDFGINSPLSSELFNSELRYSYGAPKGRGKAEVALLFKKLRLGHVDDIKNTDIDFYNYVRGQEWHENGLIAELSDQYSRTTRFRYRFINNQRHYEVDSQKDNDEYYLEYGIKSQLTGKTRVDANVAWLYKTFDNNPNARDFSGVNWDIQAEWKPLEQSVFTVHTSQHIKDPSEVGGYIMASKYGISYQHFWLADRFSTTFDYSYLAEGYKNYPKDRKDRNRVFTFAMSYNFRPSINVELKYQLNTLRSNQDTDSFFIGPDGDRQVVRMLGRDNSLIMFTAKVQI